MRGVALLLGLSVLPAFAEEKAKPNTLTPKEVADGWILLFDGETTFGWKVEGKAAIKDQRIMLGGEEKSSLARVVPLSSFDFSFDLLPVYGDCDFVLQTEKSNTRIALSKGALRVSGEVRRGKSTASTVKSKDTVNATDDYIYIEATVDSPCNIRIETAKGQSIALTKFRLLPTDTKPLFNAKDLTGWKTYDPAKAKAADPKAKDVKVTSKYSVTKEGWLNVKDGPGDLQTEGQWADFILQLECISNGKHLNSGLFFRCIADLYQQGYEAQIRNQWEGDDRTKPVDFGTGAIYRRQPARKVVSTDGEWFTMTVAAHGRHIATWVNGYQVADWTDDRKEAENARNGFKKGKGALSIQGHDPTTDLSFRNIRLQSLDPK